MVNNFISINKTQWWSTISSVSTKRSDGQQFHQYRQSAVMVNNFISINKVQWWSTISSVSTKRSDGQQFHQYQQSAVMVNNFISINKVQWWSTISSVSTKRTITSYPNSLNTKKRPQHMTLEIQVLARDRHNNVAGLNLLMGSQLKR